tara:strand:- start:1609 stop:1854 length:246 start_codon:yes stop_codon:yes gene_type:complete
MTKNLDKIIKYAWHDKTSFDQIKKFFSISEGELNKLMRYNLKNSSYKIWRIRIKGRKSKHRKKFKLYDKEKSCRQWNYDFD